MSQLTVFNDITLLLMLIGAFTSMNFFAGLTMARLERLVKYIIALVILPMLLVGLFVFLNNRGL